jgi:hypothetical protein
MDVDLSRPQGGRAFVLRDHTFRGGNRSSWKRPASGDLSSAVTEPSPSKQHLINISPTGNRNMNEKPIARCEANHVEAYTYPFYVKPEQGMEPAYIFLEEHVYNFDADETREIMGQLVRIDKEGDLKKLGYQKDNEGIYVLSPVEKPWLQGGKS